MARKLRDNYNIDTLRLCFKQPAGLFEMIAGNKPNTKIQRDGYYLLVLECDEEEEIPRIIVCKAIADTGEEIGTITFNSGKTKYGQLCFIKLDNKALYTVISTDPNGNKSNLIHCLDYIADDLWLSFISITELHIALDSNINRIAKLMRFRRDVSRFDMIVNRKRVDATKEKIPGYKEVFQSERKRRVNPSIYIEQKKDNAPKLCIYNKTVEIAEESGKEYENEWNGFGKQITYRSELRLKWEYIKEYFAENDISGYDIFMAILNPKTIKDIFHHFVTRLVYFRNKKTNDILSLPDIA